jgi:hypothetical protein
VWTAQAAPTTTGSGSTLDEGAQVRRQDLDQKTQAASSSRMLEAVRRQRCSSGSARSARDALAPRRRAEIRGVVLKTAASRRVSPGRRDDSVVDAAIHRASWRNVVRIF